MAAETSSHANRHMKMISMIKGYLLSEEDIFDTINVLRTKKKKRPDRKAIFDYINGENSVSKADFDELFESLVENGAIFSKPTTRGLESFYVNEVTYADKLANNMCSLYADSNEKSPTPVSPAIDIQTGDKSSTYLDSVDMEMESLEKTFSEYKSRVETSDKGYLSLLLENYRETIVYLKEEILLKNNIIKELLATKDQKQEKCKQTVCLQTVLTGQQVAPSNEEVNIYDQKSTVENLNEQLKEVRLKNKQKYYQEQSEATANDSITNSKDDSTTNDNATTKLKDDLCTDSNENSTTNSTREEPDRNSQWRHGTTLIVGDSMLGGIVESRIGPRRNIKVRSFPGATIADMHHYIKPLLLKSPSRIILHVGTNDACSVPAKDIADNLLLLQNYIKAELPNCHIIISSPVNRLDCKTKALIIRNVNVILKNMLKTNIDLISNDNITSDHLGKKKLHLNVKGSSILAKNFLSKLRCI